jgi:hypothetical protein
VKSVDTRHLMSLPERKKQSLQSASQRLEKERERGDQQLTENVSAGLLGFPFIPWTLPA